MENLTQNNSQAGGEKKLQENYFPTEEAIMLALDSSRVKGVLRNYIFYDKRLKSFLVVDMYGVSDYKTKSEKKLREKNS